MASTSSSTSTSSVICSPNTALVPSLSTITPLSCSSSSAAAAAAAMGPPPKTTSNTVNIISGSGNNKQKVKSEAVSIAAAKQAAMASAAQAVRKKDMVLADMFLSPKATATYYNVAKKSNNLNEAKAAMAAVAEEVVSFQTDADTQDKFEVKNLSSKQHKKKKKEEKKNTNNKRPIKSRSPSLSPSHLIIDEDSVILGSSSGSINNNIAGPQLHHHNGSMHNNIAVSSSNLISEHYMKKQQQQQQLHYDNAHRGKLQSMLELEEPLPFKKRAKTITTASTSTQPSIMNLNRHSIGREDNTDDESHQYQKHNNSVVIIEQAVEEEDYEEDQQSQPLHHSTHRYNRREKLANAKTGEEETLDEHHHHYQHHNHNFLEDQRRYNNDYQNNQHGNYSSGLPTNDRNNTTTSSDDEDENLEEQFRNINTLDKEFLHSFETCNTWGCTSNCASASNGIGMCGHNQYGEVKRSTNSYENQMGRGFNKCCDDNKEKLVNLHNGATALGHGASFLQKAGVCGEQYDLMAIAAWRCTNQKNNEILKIVDFYKAMEKQNRKELKRAIKQAKRETKGTPDQDASGSSRNQQ